MSQLTNSKLTDAEAAYLESYGKDLGTSARRLNPDNTQLARIVNLLCMFNPGDPLFRIPILDVAAACRIYDVDFLDSVESIAAVIAQMNKTISEKANPAQEMSPPWRQ